MSDGTNLWSRMRTWPVLVVAAVVLVAVAVFAWVRLSTGEKPYALGDGLCGRLDWSAWADSGLRVSADTGDDRYGTGSADCDREFWQTGGRTPNGRLHLIAEVEPSHEAAVERIRAAYRESAGWGPVTLGPWDECAVNIGGDVRPWLICVKDTLVVELKIASGVREPSDAVLFSVPNQVYGLVTAPETG